MKKIKPGSVRDMTYSDRESGIYGGILLSLRDYYDRFEFYRGFQLNAKPREIDCLIIDKRDDSRPIDNAIARIFSEHNIVEIKNPFESLSIDTIWKVISYAAQYKSEGESIDEIKTVDVTITIIRVSKPRKAFKMLIENGYVVEKQCPGIYYINGMADFRMQIVVSSELEGDEFVPLRIQRPNATEQDFHLFANRRKTIYNESDRKYVEIVMRYGLYGSCRIIKEGTNMKTMYQEVVEMHKEETDRHVKALLMEGVSVEKIARCLELPKSRVQKLKKSLVVTN